MLLYLLPEARILPDTPGRAVVLHPACAKSPSWRAISGVKVLHCGQNILSVEAGQVVGVAQPAVNILTFMASEFVEAQPHTGFAAAIGLRG